MIRDDFEKEIESYISTWGESPTHVRCNSSTKEVLLIAAHAFNIQFKIDDALPFGSFKVEK